jgi:hypothetical protein
MPTEAMSGRIVRHFERLRAPKAKSVRIVWPEGATECSPAELGSVFDGDSLTVSARLPALDDSAKVVLELETEAGNLSRQALTLKRSEFQGTDAGPSTIARLAAANRLLDANDDAARAIALKYRLLSPYTNWIVVAERSAEGRLDAAPALRVVPQTLAAGWGGTGSVPQNRGILAQSLISGPALVMSTGREAGSRMRFGIDSSASSLSSACIDTPTVWRGPREPASRGSAGADRADASFDVSAFLSGDADGSSRPDAARKGDSGSHGTHRLYFYPDSKIRNLIRLIEEDPSWLDEGRSMELLREAGFDELIDEIFSLIGGAPLNRRLAIEMLLGVMLSDQVISALPANLQSPARKLHHHGLQIVQESMLTSTRAAKAFEFLIRSEPHDLFEPQIIDKARWALEPLADLRRVIEKIESCAKHSAQEAIREGLARSTA